MKVRMQFLVNSELLEVSVPAELATPLDNLLQVLALTVRELSEGNTTPSRMTLSILELGMYLGQNQLELTEGFLDMVDQLNAGEHKAHKKSLLQLVEVIMDEDQRTESSNPLFFH